MGNRGPSQRRREEARNAARAAKQGKAKNLANESPRSPLDEIQGFPWLPRLIDKVRAKHAGTLGEYTPYPCGADKRFLTIFGIDQDALEQFIVSGVSDKTIADWCEQYAQHKPSEVADAFRAASLEPVKPELQAHLKEAIDKLAIERPELDLSQVDNFTKLILVEEGYLQ